MRDSRVILWTNPSPMSASITTVTGPTVDLLEGYNGSQVYGTSLYGFGAEIMVYGVVVGTDADGGIVTFKWQVAPDNGSGAAGTFVDAETIGAIAYNAAGLFTIDGTVGGTAFPATLTRAKLKARLRTAKRFCRLVATGTDLEGTVALNTKAWLSDGTIAFGDSGVIN